MFLTKTANPPSLPARPDKAGKKAVPSVVSSDLHLLGNVVSDGVIDFDGTIDGNIRCHSLVLRHNSKVNGEIHAENVQVFGRVKGLIKAKCVQLQASCSVEGIIMHEMISIEDGAVIDGKLKRTNKAANNTGNTDGAADEEFNGSDEIIAPPKLLENIRLIAG